MGKIFVTVFLIWLIVMCVLSSRHRGFTRLGMVHDYQFAIAERTCAKHQGLHYVVNKMEVYKRNSPDSDEPNYPCNETLYIRCQDGSLHSINDGVGWCSIPEMQLQETLEGKNDND